MRLMGAVGCGLLIASSVLAQDFSDVKIEAEPVRAGIYMLTGRGGNIGLSVGEDGAFIIDDQYAPLTAKIEAAISALSDQKVRFVINTHWHGDHTGGNENFGKSGAVIVAHDNIYERMSTDQVISFFNAEVPASPQAALPVVTFNDRATLRLNGDNVHAIHIPNAHTDGDAIIHFEKANVLHMGDTFFHQMYPFIDLDSGGSIDGILLAAKKGLALSNADTKIIPGHGVLTDRSGLLAYRDMLQTIRDRVATAKAGGSSLEETIAAEPGREWNERLGGGFIKPDQLVTFIYNSL